MSERNRQRAIRVAVCGGSLPDDSHIPLAEQVGELLADHGAVVVCGGLGGVMEAVARGATSHGGFTVGILPGRDARDANDFITLPLPSAMGEMRNTLVVNFAEAVIAVGGEWGTLSEIAFAMRVGRPVVLLAPTLGRNLPIDVADTPEEAVRVALAAARAGRGS